MLSIALAVTLLLGACGAESSSSDTVGVDTTATESPGTTGAGAEPASGGGESGVLLEIGNRGGFVMIDFALRQFPTFVLTADGTLYSQGPVAEIFPGPAVPNIVRGTVGEDVMARVLQYIEDMALADVEDVFIDDAASVIADAPETYVTYFDGNGAHTISVYALGLDQRPMDARVGQLTGLIDTLTSAAATSTESYVPERFELHAFDGGAGDPDLANTMPWPLDVAYDDIVVGETGTGCVLVEGAAADELYPVIAKANELTRFDDGTAERGLVFKPLFPHQSSDCRPL